MKIEKALNRDRKINRRKNGMRISGESVKEIERLQRERALKIKKEREEKEALSEILGN